MKIALIQQKATQNIQHNIEKGIASVRTAAEKKAKIICFAELAFTPFYPQKKSEGQNLVLAETIPGCTTNLFSSIAKELGVVIILNLYENLNGKTFDSSPVIDADGKILGITRMVHITNYKYFYEKGYYEPGDSEAKVYDTAFGKVGVAICYDRHYPEYMRALALNGAEIVFIPQAGSVGEWPEGLYEAELRVAAFQNGYYTALCNRVGEEEFLVFSGESFVCNPNGEVIERTKEKIEEILVCDVNFLLNEKSHAKKLFFKDRRPELYKEWFNNK